MTTLTAMTPAELKFAIRHNFAARWMQMGGSQLATSQAVPKLQDEPAAVGAASDPEPPSAEVERQLQSTEKRTSFAAKVAEWEHQHPGVMRMIRDRFGENAGVQTISSYGGWLVQARQVRRGEKSLRIAAEVMASLAALYDGDKDALAAQYRSDVSNSGQFGGACFVFDVTQTEARGSSRSGGSRRRFRR